MGVEMGAVFPLGGLWRRKPGGEMGAALLLGGASREAGER